MMNWIMKGSELMDRFEPVVDGLGYADQSPSNVYHRGNRRVDLHDDGYDDDYDADYDDASYGVLDRILAAPGKWVMAAVALAAFGLVGVNAAYLQPGAHPAPMLSTRGDAPAQPLETELLAGTARTVTLAPSPIVPPSRTYDRTASISQLQAEIGAGVPTVRAPYSVLSPLPRPDLPVSTAVQTVPSAVSPPQATPQTAQNDAPAQVQTVQAQTPVQTIAVTDPIGALLAPVASAVIAAQSPNQPAQPTAATRSAQPVVFAVQSVLAEMGYSPGTIDGVMGASTEEAIRRFQLRRALEPNGQITGDLLREIERVSGTRIAPS